MFQFNGLSSRLTPLVLTVTYPELSNDLKSTLICDTGAVRLHSSINLGARGTTGHRSNRK